MQSGSIGTEAIERVAKKVFGSSVSVRCVRAIEPSRSHGIQETPPSTRNILYVVELDGQTQPYVFRFSRVNDDVYVQEERNYRLLAEKTGVRVPTIYEVDTSGDIVATSYMVMDYLHGKLWNYAAHPENPNTSPDEKAAIEEAVGRFYADVHQHKEDATPPAAEAQTLLYAMDRLEIAAKHGRVPATAADVDRCRRSIREETAFQDFKRSICLADTEIHVAKEGGEWGVAFICDAEWVGFRHPYFDLTQHLAGPMPWWNIVVPAPFLDAETVAARPLFRAYDRRRDIDFRELLRLAAYFQLGLWAYVAVSSTTPDKVRWVKSKEDLLGELVKTVAGRHLSVPVH